MNEVNDVNGIMTDKVEEIVNVNTSDPNIPSIRIEEELQKSYLDYAMSVIVGRALPDVRDGLKPVHRRVLYAMRELGNYYNKPYKKSARIVGDVIGKYHPHGDSAVYETIVRMAQDFSMRYVLVDGQGNFGSIDGDSPAAMRYTEIRLAKIAHSLLIDLDKETVDFAPNYDGTEIAPVVFPTRIPNLLVNGSSGIAVGMATNIPPHNLEEVVSAVIAVIDNPEISIDEIIQQHIFGPDFPTAGIITGRAGIVDAYKTGRGKVCVRARATVEQDEKGRDYVLISELPYQVNKSKLLEKVGELVRDKKIEGISVIRDESDKDGMRVVIEIKRGENAEVILRNLFIHTQLEESFCINVVALVNGRPETLNLRQLIDEFLKHRREVISKRSVYELKQAKARSHILEGLSVAIENIDEIISLIKKSRTPAIAMEELMHKVWQTQTVGAFLKLKSEGVVNELSDSVKKVKFDGALTYKFSEEQAKAILELKLQRLTALEKDKILDEYKNLLDQIAKLLSILSEESVLIDVLKKELIEVKEQFGDKRRTEIVEDMRGITMEDLIVPENVVVTLSRDGYIKYQSLSEYNTQRRGGKGKTATSVKETDVVINLFVVHTHDTILCFSDKGKVYWIKVYMLPQASRISLGKPIVNLLSLGEGEKINSVLPVKQYSADKFVFMATAYGTIKKVALSAFSNPRSNGIIAIDLKDGDCLIGVEITDGSDDIMLFSNSGRVVRFCEKEVRSTGRTAQGVRGMRMKSGQKLVSLVVLKNELDTGSILTAITNGLGKRTKVSDYPRLVHRGGVGVISIKVPIAVKVSLETKVVGAVYVDDKDEIMMITSSGVLVRTNVKGISVISRNTKGVRLISLAKGEKIAAIERIKAFDNVVPELVE